MVGWATLERSPSARHQEGSKLTDDDFTQTGPPSDEQSHQGSGAWGGYLNGRMVIAQEAPRVVGASREIAALVFRRVDKVLDVFQYCGS